MQGLQDPDQSHIGCGGEAEAHRVDRQRDGHNVCVDSWMGGILTRYMHQWILKHRHKSANPVSAAVVTCRHLCPTQMNRSYGMQWCENRQVSRRGRYLGGSTGGVHQADGLRADIGCLQRSDEELVVGLVDGVAALEGQHVLALWQGGAHIGGGGAGEHPLGQLQPLHLATCTSSMLCCLHLMSLLRSIRLCSLVVHESSPMQTRHKITHDQIHNGV